MKIRVLLIFLSSQLLFSCFSSKKPTIPLPENFHSLVRTVDIKTEIIKKENDHILTTSPLKFYLSKKSTLKWYEELKEIELIKATGDQDLSKIVAIGSLDFKSSEQTLFIELFSIQDVFFIKLRLKELKENKLSYLSGQISKENAQKLLRDFKTFHTKKLLLPLTYETIQYITKNTKKTLSASEALTAIECLNTFRSEKTVYQGNIDPSTAYKYFIGKKINANLTGFFRISNQHKEIFDVHMGKPNEAGIKVRFWVKRSGEIKEGDLPCLGKLRELSQL